ncbi:MAG: apolipoprotein N-acyltransferase, partial [Gammaproteobacteria bacterium]|nr:apolipoprotein N-acyltransferase [Gammaproteobacteria bacterium]
MIVGLRQRYGAWLAFAAGLPVPLAFSPFDSYLLLPLLLACLLWLIDDVTPRVAAWRGWLFGAGAFLTGTYWLYVSIHVFGEAPLVLALLLMAALMAFMACYSALACYVAARYAPAGALRWLAAFPACWVLAEWLRGWFLSGFPWLSLGYSTTSSMLAGYIPLGGIFAASAAVAVSAGALRTLAGGDIRERVVAVGLLAATWAFGWWSQQVPWTDAAEDTLTVSIVQGAIPQDRKWLPEELVPTMRLYRDLTRQHWDSDLVIWPEAAIPALRVSLVDYYAKIALEGEAYDTEIVTGTIEYDPVTNSYYNGVIALRGSQNVYHKRHLVPFGEYFPVPGFVREWLRLRNLPYSDYTSGGDDQRPLQVAGQKIAPSICYEDVFGNEQRLMLPEATLLVNVSNDAWFGTSIAPHQHMQIARARAIETGRYLLRATNTGVSAVIAPDGRIEQ